VITASQRRILRKLPFGGVGLLILVSGWFVGTRSKDTSGVQPPADTTALQLVKYRPEFRTPKQFEQPKVLRGYYVTLDLSVDVARRVASAAGFSARLTEDDTSWSVEQGNRHFQMDRRYGGRWLVRLVDPLCASPNPCEPGSGVRGQPKQAASAATAKRKLEDLSRASELPIRAPEMSGGPVGNLYHTKAPAEIDSLPVLGDDIEVTINHDGVVLFASGFVGPLLISEEVPARTLGSVIEELKSVGVVAAQGSPRTPIIISRTRLVYQRVPSRGLMVTGMRPFDIVPAYELLTDTNATYVVAAVAGSETFVGGPASDASGSTQMAPGNIVSITTFNGPLS
jgi:hypothetical protein